ncbi:urease accessory protein UreD [Salicibibacter kimchii]|uniref:Urease accessory protein UreD n=1 Tax=Salicibibacter kimchii TaxID=2099786 RepID=A0A345C0K1_9BACI|nr:urease accessory protein UreD [Salicibibacter kimchii]AXF56732.1 urease accessory protein UreD [Salicibibacter kimchii]
MSHHGKLLLNFQRKNHRTRLIDCYQQSPLKASRELYLDDKKEQATVYLMESSGGMVAGDRNEYDIHLKEHADVCLIEQSATKVYPSYNHRCSTQKISVQLEEGACLEWIPEAIIPYQDARYQGDTVIRMKKGSTLLWGEIISPGREKRDECFLYNEFQSRFQIWVEGECLAYDPIQFYPDEMPLQQAGMLEESLYIGTLWFVSPRVPSLDVQYIHDKLQDCNHTKASVTTLEGKGLQIRWLATDLWAMKEEMNTVCHRFRNVQEQTNIEMPSLGSDVI